MEIQPTYEDLEQRIKALEHEVNALRKLEKVAEGYKRDEHLFRTLIEHSSFVHGIVDAEGNSLYTSPSVAVVYGWDPEEIRFKNVFERIHPDDIDLAAKKLAEIIDRPGKAGTMEVRYRHKDGAWRNIEVRGVNMLDNPSIRGIVLTSHDITEKKEAAAALRESEEKFKTIFETASDEIIYHDLAGNILDVNSKVEDILG